MNDVIIVGFPKSGNTWLARLMGDALNRPIRGTENARPLAAEGEERGDGRGIVRQLHLVPQDNIDDRRYPGFVASPWSINPEKRNGEQVIHIIRDPRDVAIAIDAYWEINNLHKTLGEIMRTGAWPLWGRGWESYLAMWRKSSVAHFETRYEWLHADTLLEMRRLCDLMSVKVEHPLDEVVQRQSFDERKAQIARDGENMPHGITAQKKNLRRGIVGDWRNVYTAEHKQLAREVFGDMLIELGYESSDDWVN